MLQQFLNYAILYIVDQNPRNLRGLGLLLCIGGILYGKGIQIN